MTATSDANVILSARGLGKNFKGFQAVHGVRLDVLDGSIHGLIGPNGAGKTTCFNLLTKFLEPSSGTIRFKGRDITRAKPATVARMGLVRSFQISAVFAGMTCRENLRIALQRPRGLATQFWTSDRRLRALDGRVDELLESVGLETYAETPAGELSYGRKRALELATTLALEPEMMLLDEPMAGMAHEDIEQVVTLIRKVAKGRTLLMVEHNLNVVSDLCDRVTVLQRGEILAEGTYAAVAADPRVKEAYLGSDHDD
jgi:branched-chain amino acid transport system ATP-binding protein